MSKTIKYKQGLNYILIALSICLFLGFQFYSIYFRWYNHPGPLGLGDSDYYISRINYFKNFDLWNLPDFYQYLENPSVSLKKDYDKGFMTFHGLTSSWILGKLAVFFNFSAEKIFYINFYAGITMMTCLLYFIFKKIGNYPLNIITGFILLTFYHGGGGYHGFSWVVPSFYNLFLFLFLFYLLFNAGKSKIFSFQSYSYYIFFLIL